MYATHGHGDHWFGTDLLLQRFPDAVAYATNGTIAMMHQQGTVGRAELWDVDFPGQIPPSPVNYRTIPVDGIELEGHRLLAVEVGHTDTDDTTVLHVPSIGLVVAGDVAYNGVHQYLLESAHGGVEAWLVALDKVAALQPRAVVAGHKNKDLPDDPAIIDQTRDYLLNARRLLAEKPSPREYFDEMIALYPDRLNVGPVWYTAVALLSGASDDSRTKSAHWFFDDYLTTWIGVGAGTIARGPEFILDYWSAPLNWSDDQGSRWILDAPAVVAQLHALQTRLRAAGLRAHRGARPQGDGLSRQRRSDRSDLVTPPHRRHRDRASGCAFRGGTRTARLANHQHPGHSRQPATHSNAVWPQAN